MFCPNLLFFFQEINFKKDSINLMIVSLIKEICDKNQGMLTLQFYS